MSPADPYHDAEPFFPPVDRDWLGRRQEAVLEPALPIIDPHHHLWDRPDWRYLFDDLLGDVRGGHNVVATVFLQCREMHRADGPEALRPVGETEFVNGVAAMSASGKYGNARICDGIVGYADLTLGAAVQPVLDAHRIAGGSRFRGIRHGAASNADPAFANKTYQPAPGLLLDKRFREGFACLAPSGLSFDAWLYHPQIDELTSLAQAFPDTPIVLDHVGGPLGIGGYAGRRDELFAGWQQSIRRLALCPNVFVKLGGLGMRVCGFGYFRLPQPPSSEQLANDWRPYVDTCIDAFGTDRSMFESNFPVDKASCSYTVLWNAFKRLAAGCTPAEKADLFAGSAARFYRLNVPG